MTDNPYSPPDAQADSDTKPSRIYSRVALLSCCVLAAMHAASFYVEEFLSYSALRNFLVSFLAFWCPGIAIFIAAIASAKSLFALSVARMIRRLSLVLGIAAAGYVGFVATCCSTNMVLGSTAFKGTPNAPYTGPAFVVAVVSFFCTLGACWLVAFVVGRIQRPPRQANRP